MRILVIDDDPKILAVLRRALQSEGYEVVEATNGWEGLGRLREGGADLVLLDWLMPGLDGLTLCRKLKEERPSLPVLMLTARDRVADRVEGLDAGADDYLVKPFALEELLARVRALLRRAAPPRGGLLCFADLRLDEEGREAWRGSRPLSLTAKEFDLLAHFLRHPRQVLTRDGILDQVWGYDFEGGSNVVEVYVGYLRQKLEAGGEPRLIQTVRGVGYVLREG